MGNKPSPQASQAPPPPKPHTWGKPDYVVKVGDKTYAVCDPANNHLHKKPVDSAQPADSEPPSPTDDKTTEEETAEDNPPATVIPQQRQKTKQKTKTTQTLVDSKTQTKIDTTESTTQIEIPEHPLNHGIIYQPMMSPMYQPTASPMQQFMVSPMQQPMMMMDQRYQVMPGYTQHHYLPNTVPVYYQLPHGPLNTSRPAIEYTEVDDSSEEDSSS